MLADDVVAIASGEVGYQQGPGAISKYAQWYGALGLASGGMFVSWVYAQAGFPLNIVNPKGFDHAIDGYNFYVSAGKIIPSILARPADLIFYDWGHRVPSWVGIVLDYQREGNYWDTIELANAESADEVGRVVKRLAYGGVFGIARPVRN